MNYCQTLSFTDASITHHFQRYALISSCIDDINILFCMTVNIIVCMYEYTHDYTCISIFHPWDIVNS